MIAVIQSWVDQSPYSEQIKKILGFFGIPFSQTNPFPSDFTEKILAISTQLGWKINIKSENYISMLFALDDDRDQLVHLFSIEAAGQAALQVSSPAVSVEDIPQDSRRNLFNEMLGRNSRATNFAWAITKTKEREILIANYELLLNTLDVDELASCVWNIANVADEMESRFGQDKF